ncbi:MAG: porin [Verrucomicrobia bacterium]|nr:porin [Verrucomicrobiota bacterium]
MKHLACILFLFSLCPGPMVNAGEPAAPPAAAEGRVRFSAVIQAGLTLGTQDGPSHQLYGRVFDDRRAEPLLHQLTLTAERALVSGKGKFDWGFKLQVSAGSDARFINTIGTFDQLAKGTYSFALVEAYLTAHFPILSAGGVDLKAGQFATLLGSEYILPTANIFYSHNYIFNFGIPLQHLGAFVTWHATPQLDLLAGVTRGVNVSLTDNNGSAAFTGGLALNLFDGKAALGYYTHIGPENARDRRNIRQFHSLTATIKPTDRLALITDALYVRDGLAGGLSAYGLSQTVQYTFNKTLSLAVRAEVFRDADGFYVGQFAKGDNFVDFIRGDFSAADPKTLFAGRSTYFAVTAGANIKPQFGKLADKLILRPEVRYDHSSAPAFKDLTKKSQVTFGVDVLLTF